jgi:hypothetical protein
LGSYQNALSKEHFITSLYGHYSEHCNKKVSNEDRLKCKHIIGLCGILDWASEFPWNGGQYICSCVFVLRRIYIGKSLFILFGVIIRMALSKEHFITSPYGHYLEYCNKIVSNEDRMKCKHIIGLCGILDWASEFPWNG